MLVLVITDINTPTICMPVYISYLQLNDVVGTVVTQANCSDDDVTRKFQPRIYTITYIGPGKKNIFNGIIIIVNVKLIC